MIERIITGVVGIVLAFLTFLTYNTYWLNIIFTVVIVLTVCEVLSACKVNMNKPLFGVSCFFAGTIPMCDLLKLYVNRSDCIIMISLVFALVLAVMLLFLYARFDYAKISFTGFITLAISFGLSCCIFVRDYVGAHYLYYIITILAGIWGQDTAAYFIGSLIGKHKLAPKISPKKTVEGAIGGIVGSVVLVLLVSAVYSQIALVHPRYAVLVVFALLMAFVGMIGDLFFSIIKRQCGIKDYGYILPGHGGFLDRFDSMVFGLPIAFFFIQYFPLIK